ncbi:MAG: hypothetical protein HKP61_18190 [Dactylosporangium sp.]|nr:hypothetical protein [Dactylosporangium sp.]
MVAVTAALTAVVPPLATRRLRGGAPETTSTATQMLSRIDVVVRSAS